MRRDCGLFIIAEVYEESENTSQNGLRASKCKEVGTAPYNLGLYGSKQHSQFDTRMLNVEVLRQY